MRASHGILVLAGLLAPAARAETGTLFPEAEARREFHATAGTGDEPGTRAVRVAPSARERFDAVLVNPFLAFDLGLALRPSLVTDATEAQVVSWLVHAAGADAGALPVTRLRRDGRAVPLGYAPLASPLFSAPSLVRVLQKGDLETGAFGGHEDGHVDALEAFREMVYGEILHRHGLLTSRALLGARLAGVRRRLAPLQTDAPAAGVEIRVGERPRFTDEGVPPYHALLGNAPPAWQHPLLVSGLEHLPPERRARMVATLNEGMLKDLWALHGSLIDENRSEVMIDLATLSFLSEPSPGASTGGATGYGAEVRRSAETPDSRFLDALAFHQLRRFGLPDEVILDRYFERRVEAIGGGELVTYRAREPALALARGVLALDELTDSKSAHRFRADEIHSAGTEYRVVFNTRTLLRRLLLEPERYLAHASLSDDQVRRLLEGSRNELFAGENPLDGKLAHVRGKMYEQVRAIHAALRLVADHVESHRAAVTARAEHFPVAQRLPARHEVQRRVEGWLERPERLPERFREYVESFDAAEQRAALARHYSRAPSFPADTAPRLFRWAVAALSAAGCEGVYRALSPDAPLVPFPPAIAASRR